MRLDHDVVPAAVEMGQILGQRHKKFGNAVKSSKNILHQQFHFEECIPGKHSQESQAICMSMFTAQ